jgi:YafQ family addiction module toxin component
VRSCQIESQVEKELSKIKKKAKTRYETIKLKMAQILSVRSVQHYKNLRKPLQKYKRVHIDSSFVLIFSHNAKNDTVKFVKLEHHDNVYK